MQYWWRPTAKGMWGGGGIDNLHISSVTGLWTWPGVCASLRNRSKPVFPNVVHGIWHPVLQMFATAGIEGAPTRTLKQVSSMAWIKIKMYVTGTGFRRCMPDRSWEKLKESTGFTSSTLWAVLAEVSKKTRPCSFANCSPSSVVTALRCCK